MTVDVALLLQSQQRLVIVQSRRPLLEYSKWRH